VSDTTTNHEDDGILVGSASERVGEPATAISRAGVGFRSERGPVLIALMLGTGLVAMDSTIVATSVQSIVADLGGFAQFPWLFSIYLLTAAVFTPIYGKVADLIGRKPLMLFGIGLFMVGSIAAGFAWSMPVLIAFRAVQGVGAGAVQPMAMTIAGDIYTVAERAVVTGYLSSVWAIAAIAGPSIGGFFAEYVSWRWVFFINVPLCLAAAWMLLRSFHETVERRKHRIDYTGAILITAGCTLVILAMLEGGQSWAWASPAGIAVPGAGALLLAAFVIVERRAAEPILPLWVLTRRVLLSTSVATFAIGAAAIGLTAYIPTFVQGSLGFGALVAGFVLAPMSLGWPLFSSLSGRVYLRFGFRFTSLAGATLVLAAMVGMLSLDEHSSVIAVAAWCFAFGCGMGLASSPALIAAQASVGWSQRGVVTGTNMFARSIGSSIGMAVFGAVANAVPLARAGKPTPAELASATHWVLLTIVVVGAIMLVSVVFMPGGRDTSQVAD
jgi:EmrB/QacA subfamily drug resistance transporter